MRGLSLNSIHDAAFWLTSTNGEGASLESSEWGAYVLTDLASSAGVPFQVFQRQSHLDRIHWHLDDVE